MTAKPQLEAYLLRSGPEANFNSLVGELSYSTDTVKLLLKTGGAEPAAVPTNKTTGTFSYSPNLEFLSLNIGAGSKINNTKIGEDNPETGSFKNVIMNHNDSGVLQFRSSVVNHGHSNFLSTNSYGEFSRISQSNGGLSIKAGGSDTNSLLVEGVSPASTVDTNVNLEASQGIIEIVASATTDGDLVDMASSEILLSVAKRNGDSSLSRVAHFTADGDLFVSGETGQITFDTFDDVRLMSGLRGLLSSVPSIKEQFKDDIEYAQPVLERYGILSVKPDGTTGALNLKKALVAVIDAIRQLDQKFSTQEA